MYQQTVAHPRLRSTDRLYWAWLSRLWPCWHAALAFVQPRTVIAADSEVVKLEWGCRYEPGGLRLLPFTLPRLPAREGWENIDGCGVSHELLDAVVEAERLAPFLEQGVFRAIIVGLRPSGDPIIPQVLAPHDPLLPLVTRLLGLSRIKRVRFEHRCR